MTLFLFLIILAVLVLVHEAGHFIAARACGIRVDEFGLGFPPRLFSWKRGETRYSVNLIPFGGFVKIFGEDGEVPNADVAESAEPFGTRNFARKPRALQAFVLVAGIIGNFLLAFVLLSLGFMSGMPAPVDGEWGLPVTNAALTIVEVLPDSPADRAGLRAGDKIVSLAYGGHLLTAPSPDAASAFIADTQNETIALSVERREEPLIFSITPMREVVEGRQAIGVAMDMLGIVQLPLHRAVLEGAKATVFLSAETARALVVFIKDVFTGNADLQNLAGPVGIAGLVGQARAEGAAHILSLTALISINLALINLIPFPALDGGRLLFVAIEAVRRKPIPARFAQTANAAGFILLLLFIVFVTYHDISRLFSS